MFPKRHFARGKSPGGKKFGSTAYKGRGFGDKNGGVGGHDQAPQMHAAVCASCGKTAEVPFRPNGRTPVYCKTCFRNEDREPRATYVPGSYGKPRFASKRSYDAAPKRDDQLEQRLEAMHIKLDRIIRDIEAMKAGRM